MRARAVLGASRGQGLRDEVTCPTLVKPSDPVGQDQRNGWVPSAPEPTSRPPTRIDSTGGIAREPRDGEDDLNRGPHRHVGSEAGRSLGGSLGGRGSPARDGGRDLGDDLALLDTQLRRARRPGLLTLPEHLRSGRIHVSSAAIVAVMALVVALACAFLLRILWAERTAVPAPPAAPAVISTGDPLPTNAALPSGGATITSGDGPRADSPGGAMASQVVVHVIGQVRRPGLARLDSRARVADAIEAAGGTTKNADLAGLNLARALTDGEQVVVPKPGETLAPPGGAGAGAAAPGADPGGRGPGGLVNLNTASLAELDTLPGVGPVLAQRILDWRAEHGRFSAVDELGEVSGIGDKVLGRLRPKVTV